MIVLIIGHFSTSAKFRGNIKIPWKRANSAAQLEILRPAENCGTYLSLWNIALSRVLLVGLVCSTYP